MVTEKKKQTRQRILDSAWRLFKTAGFAETTTRQIALEAGVGAGTVFSHFPTKMDLLKAGLSHQIDDVLSQARLTDNATDPKARLMHYAGFLYAFYAQQTDFSREMFKELIWQQNEMREHVEPFQALLYSKSGAYDPITASVMMDCYFMTLFNGLSDKESSSQTMLEMLERKLVTIG